MAGPFRGFFDDAALFPPGELPLAEAIPAHRDHREAWYAAMVGPFVFPASRLDELTAVLDGRIIALSMTLPGGPAKVRPALQALSVLDAVRLESVEVALPQDVTAAELVATLDEHLPADVAGYVEVPRDERRPSTLDALAGTRYRAKFRTGGVVPEAHPGERELAAAIGAVIDRGLEFKCTAGLHHAVRHTDGALEQHGFLNVLLATEAALQGAGSEELVSLLAERSGEAIADKVRAVGQDRLVVTRENFQSFGTCSISDPVRDMVALGLVQNPKENAE